MYTQNLIKTNSSVSLPLKSMKKNGKKMGEAVRLNSLFGRHISRDISLINSVNFLDKTSFKNQLFSSYTLNKLYYQKFPVPILHNFPLTGIKRLQGFGSQTRTKICIVSYQGKKHSFASRNVKLLCFST